MNTNHDRSIANTLKTIAVIILIGIVGYFGLEVYKLSLRKPECPPVPVSTSIQIIPNKTLDDLNRTFEKHGG